MHGRLKVKTTAQQQEEKQKERAKKLVLYNAGMNKANDKRKNEDFDDEALDVTSQLLLANPDIYTMWNFRKEILQFKKQHSPSDFQTIMNGELAFTENCLRVNPKSYGSWNHRIWVLGEMPEPDWLKELKLCDKYLEIDERNFHCWGYRFFVVDQAKVRPEQELEFTDNKINSNFSNYSSWHYRSKLLPQIYPDPEKLRPIEEKKLLNEFELVQNAAFTDPNDQSAWFYHRWLLGRGEIQLDLMFLHLCRDGAVILVFSRHIQAATVASSIKLYLNGIAQETKWSQPTNKYNKVWIGQVLVENSDDLEIRADFEYEESTSRLICCLQKDSNESWVWKPLHLKCFSMELSAATASVLQQELESCIQLQELEPESKWPLLTNILLMRSLDFDKFKSEIMESFEKIINVDRLRSNYYKDLRSKFLIENAIEHSLANQTSCNLSGLNLTTLYHPEYLIHFKKLDVSNNCLHSLIGFEALICLETLIVDDNHITNCDNLQNLPKLKHLSMQGNDLATLDSIVPLNRCRGLVTLDLRRNPVCNLNDYGNNFGKLLPNLQKLDEQVISHSSQF